MSLQNGGFQFAHVDFYARTGASKRPAKSRNSMQHRDRSWSAKDIVDEAMRKQHACHHVDNPQPPTLVYGVDPYIALAEAEAWAETRHDSKGRKYRSDAPVIAAGIISLPRERFEDWAKYRDDAIEMLKQKYGDRLRSIVQHLDEAHPHIHFYVVPLPTDPDFSHCHDGYAARLESKRKNPKSAGEALAAYKAAMKRWQDGVYSALSVHHGLDRVGPRRRRLDRLAFKEQKADRKLAEAEHAAYALQLREEVIEVKENSVAQAEASLDARLGEVEQTAAAVEEKIQKLDSEKSEIKQKHAQVQAVSAAVVAAVVESSKILSAAESKKLDAEAEASKIIEAAKAEAEATAAKVLEEANKKAAHALSAAKRKNQEAEQKLSTAKTIGGMLGAVAGTVKNKIDGTEDEIELLRKRLATAENAKKEAEAKAIDAKFTVDEMIKKSFIAGRDEGVSEAIQKLSKPEVANAIKENSKLKEALAEAQQDIKKLQSTVSAVTAAKPKYS